MCADERHPVDRAGPEPPRQSSSRRSAERLRGSSRTAECTSYCGAFSGFGRTFIFSHDIACLFLAELATAIDTSRSYWQVVGRDGTDLVGLLSADGNTLLRAILSECFDIFTGSIYDELKGNQALRELTGHSPEFRERHIEAPHTGSLVAVDHLLRRQPRGTSAGSTYLQTVLDCHGRYTWAISDNSREFRGRPDQHPYELLFRLDGHQAQHYLDQERPYSTGIIERLHRTLLGSTSASRVVALVSIC